MNTIRITVDHSVLTAKPDFPLASGSVDTVLFDAGFDASWDGFTSKLVFAYKGQYPPEVREVLVSGGQGEIPWEVLAYPGELTITAVGISGGKVMPTAHMDRPLTVHYSGPISGSTSQEHSQEIWQYGLSEVKKAQAQAEQARDDAQTAAAGAAASETAAAQSREDAESARNAAEAANTQAQAAQSEAQKAALAARESQDAAAVSQQAASESAAGAAAAEESAWEAAGRAEKGDPAVLLSTTYEYQVGTSGDEPPTGTWSPERLEAPQGLWLWTRTTMVYNTGDPVVLEQATYTPHDGKGAVESVCGVSPDEEGNVSLTAENVNAVPIERTVNGKALSEDITLTADDVGAAKPSDVSDSSAETLNAAKQYTDTAKAEAIGYTNTFTRPNLLDNWYFVNPVNQRGETSYSPNYSYTIDRWIGNGAKFTLQNDGILVENAGTEDSKLFHIMDVEVYNYIKDKTRTFSILTNNGLTSVTTSVDEIISNYGPDVRVIIWDNQTIEFRFASPSSVKIIAAKLELGDTQTLAHQDANGNWVLNEVPDYGQQLARCQRYCYVINSYGNYWGILATGSAGENNDITFVIPLPTTMRAAATLSFTGAFRILNGNGVKTFDNSSVYNVHTSENMVAFDTSLAASGQTITPGIACVLTKLCDGAARVIISADI